MIEVSEAKAQFIKVCKNVKIDIDETKTMISIFVIKSKEYSFILSRLFEQ
jgi:hypothetical protein